MVLHLCVSAVRNETKCKYKVGQKCTFDLNKRIMNIFKICQKWH